MSPMINIIEDLDKGIDMKELAQKPVIKESEEDEQSNSAKNRD
ncbi:MULTISPECIES: hypothetical protein [Bacillus]|nr:MULTISPECIES: hypothetical protein [Bacillus cereus group]EOO44489.1 hypothetical protein ICK_06264 [Bacillus cereus BAG1X2-2]MEB9514113.1 hypothetical protein [Bacillus cereus]MEB9561499.1 hypothetical protein [Bacillus cereus]CUB50822.1 hypothetical protein BN2127_JRS10_00339 [Bacillus subtilis]